MEKIIIYGVPSGGVFGLRQLRKQWPQSRICVIAPKSDIGFLSNCYDHFFAASNASEMLTATESAILWLGTGKIQAFIFSNRMLEYIVSSGQSLFEKIRFQNSYEVFQQIVDKTKADGLCRSLGIARPLEYNLNENPNAISFPVVVKPLEKQQAIGASKCEFIEDQESLQKYLSKMNGLGIAFENLVCQQSIVGDNRYEYGYGGYFVEGEPTIDICFHQFRQVPQGLCCYIREITDNTLSAQLQELVKPFLTNLQYTGFIEFDIKQDANSGKLYVLDINPRPWGSVDMLRVKLHNSTVFAPLLSDKRVVWHKPFLELKSGENTNNPSYRLCKNITGTSNFMSAYELYDPHDHRPFLRTTIVQFRIFLSYIKHCICG